MSYVSAYYENSITDTFPFLSRVRQVCLFVHHIIEVARITPRAIISGENPGIISHMLCFSVTVNDVSSLVDPKRFASPVHDACARGG